jgi:flagellar M-ring protein FliF
MADFRSYMNSLKDRWKSGQAAQIVFSFLAAAAALAMVVTVSIWAAQPDWAPLYSGLSELEAAQVVSQLEEMEAPYRLTTGGSTVEVERPDLYRLRVKLAASGGPSPGRAGYELLDKPRLGMSDREMEAMQKRALEGELAKTLTALDWVDGATVHLVMPKATLFEDEQLPVTASVSLVVDGRRQIPKSDVNSVVALVSASVEGLHPNRVTVVDSSGRLLTSMHEDDELFGQSSRQMEIGRKVNDYMSRNAQAVLDRVLGSGRAVVRVAADLDFSYMERTSRIFDPEKKVVRSQEMNEESAVAPDTTATQEERQVTNFEINEVLEHSKGQQGALLRLSVSLVVDGSYVAAEEDGDPAYVPRSKDEMARLAGIVKTSVGFNAERGDVIEAHNIAFDVSRRADAAASSREAKQIRVWEDIARKALFVVGVLVFLWVLRGTISQMHGALGRVFDDRRALLLAGAKGAAEGADEEEDMPLLVELEAARSPEQRQMLRVHRKVVDYCSQNPDEAARLLRAWLVEH